jgi:hypothetical protein
MRRSVGRVVLAAVFALLALNAFWQVGLGVWGEGEPPLITALQALVGAAAASAGYGSWIGARWAPAIAALYGVIGGGMIVSLGPVLDLPAEARTGLWTGGAVVLVFGLGSAWWLRRSLRTASEAERA